MEDDDEGEGMVDPVEGVEGNRLSLERKDEGIKKIGDPKLPSENEVESHRQKGHIPYRSWCPVCVMSQGRDSQHRGDHGKERNLPEYSWDYCFPGDELGFKWTILVLSLIHI